MRLSQIMSEGTECESNNNESTATAALVNTASWQRRLSPTLQPHGLLRNQRSSSLTIWRPGTVFQSPTDFSLSSTVRHRTLIHILVGTRAPTNTIDRRQLAMPPYLLIHRDQWLTVVTAPAAAEHRLSHVGLAGNQCQEQFANNKQATVWVGLIVRLYTLKHERRRFAIKHFKNEAAK